MTTISVKWNFGDLGFEFSLIRDVRGFAAETQPGINQAKRESRSGTTTTIEKWDFATDPTRMKHGFYCDLFAILRRFSGLPS